VVRAPRRAADPSLVVLRTHQHRPAQLLLRVRVLGLRVHILGHRRV